MGAKKQLCNLFEKNIKTFYKEGFKEGEKIADSGNI